VESGANTFAGAEAAGVLLSTDNGTSWRAANSGFPKDRFDLPPSVMALAVSGTRLYAGTMEYGVFLSTNNGTHWDAINSGLEDSLVHALAVSGMNLFAGSSGGVFCSTDSGTNWTRVDSGLTNREVWSLAFSGTNLFAGTYSGLFRSTNNGTSWAVASSGLASLWVRSLTVISNETGGTRLFAGTYGEGVFLSSNSGTSWAQVDSGLPSPIVLSLAVSGRNIFAGTDSGVFLSTNEGASWTQVDSGFVDRYVNSLAVIGTNLLAGTARGGLWRRPLSEMVTSVELMKSELPQEFLLYQNYLNPFNPKTGIRYSVPTQSGRDLVSTPALRAESLGALQGPRTGGRDGQVPGVSDVKITVYDMIGKEVAVLVNERKLPGRYEVTFDGSRLASGVYFCRLQAGSFTQTRKLCLIR
jgi:photosystem II stability/assembly factor-like uncharacterized protein